MKTRYYSLLWSLAYFNFDDSQKEKMRKTLENRDFPNIGNPTLLSSRSYTFALTKIPTAYRSSTLSDDEKYAFDMNFIIHRFDGKVQEFLLADLTREYSKNNLIYVSHDTYLKNTEEILPMIQDSAYKKWALANLESFDKLSKAFPEEVFDDIVLDNGKQSMVLREMLAKYKGRPILLDFWASWCIPCIGEFEDGEEQISEWKEKGVAFLNLSIDRPSDYTKMDELANKYRFKESNYIISDFETSKLYDYLNIGRSGIPRYVLIDKNGKIQAMDMPRPSHKESFNKVMQKLTQAFIDENIVWY
jgi:thiol-disulfide isomerase/thioredoxin